MVTKTCHFFFSLSAHISYRVPFSVKHNISYTSFNLLFIFIAQLQLCYRVPLPYKMISEHKNGFCLFCYEWHAMRLEAQSCEITAHASHTSIIFESGFHTRKPSPAVGSKRHWRYGVVCVLTRPRRCGSVPGMNKRLSYPKASRSPVESIPLPI